MPLRPRGDEGEDAGDRCEDDELRGEGPGSGVQTVMHIGGNYEDGGNGDDEKYDAYDDDSHYYKTMMTMRTMTKG